MKVLVYLALSNIGDLMKLFLQKAPKLLYTINALHLDDPCIPKKLYRHEKSIQLLYINCR